MFKNVASQKLIVFAFDSTTNLPKTGDAANLTAYVSKDFGSVTVLGDTSATEMDSTNAKGYYLFDLTQAETNADALLFSAKSSTSNIVVIGAPAYIATNPASFSSFTTPPTAAQNATAVLTTQMTESYAADGVAPTLAQSLFLTQQAVTEAAIVGTTLTVNKLDGTTPAATFTLNSATTPTSRTRAT